MRKNKSIEGLPFYLFFISFVSIIVCGLSPYSLATKAEHWFSLFTLGILYPFFIIWHSSGKILIFEIIIIVLQSYLIIKIIYILIYNKTRKALELSELNRFINSSEEVKSCVSILSSNRKFIESENKTFRECQNSIKGVTRNIDNAREYDAVRRYIIDHEKVNKNFS